MRRTILGLGLLAAANPAFAEIGKDEGLYGAAGVGWNGIGSFDYRGAGVPLHLDVEGKFSGFAALGYDYPGGARTELEVAFRDLSAVSINGAPGSGQVSATSVLGNLIYEFGSERWRTRPYMGAGVGISYIEHQLFAGLGQGPGGGAAFQIDDQESALSWQIISGITHRLSDRLAIDLSYRYFDSEKAKFAARTPTGFVETDYESHSLLFSFRWMFARPSPIAAEQDEF